MVHFLKGRDLGRVVWRPCRESRFCLELGTFFLAEKITVTDCFFGNLEFMGPKFSEDVNLLVFILLRSVFVVIICFTMVSSRGI